MPDNVRGALPETFDPVEAGIVSAVVGLLPLMTVLSVRRLSALRRGR